MARLADVAHRPLRHRSANRRYEIERRHLLDGHQRQLYALIASPAVASLAAGSRAATRAGSPGPSARATWIPNPAGRPRRPPLPGRELGLSVAKHRLWARVGRWQGAML